MDSKTHHTIQNTSFYLIILASISHRHSKIRALCISSLLALFSPIYSRKFLFEFVKNVLIQTYESHIFCCKDKKFVILRTPRVHGVSNCTAVGIDHFYDVTDVTPRRGNRWGLNFEKKYGNLVIHSTQKGEREKSGISQSVQGRRR